MKFNPLHPDPFIGTLRGDAFDPSIPTQLRAARGKGGIVSQTFVAGCRFALLDALPFVAAWQLVTAVTQDFALVRMLALAGVAQIILKSFAGLYPGYGLHTYAVLQRSAEAWAGAALIAASGVWLMVPAEAGVIVPGILIFRLIVMLQACVARLARAVLRWFGLWGIRVSVIGQPERVAVLERYLAKSVHLGFVPARRTETASLVLWAGDGVPPPETLDLLRQRDAEVLLVSDLPALGLSGLKPADHRGSFGQRLTRPNTDGASRVVRRAIDLAVTVPAAVAVAPIVLLAALAIRLIDGGPAFYVHLREGQHGRKIPMLKLRTMYCDAERMLQDLLERSPAARAEWNATFKLRNDPRILPVIGGLLRASSVDELPQLVNIIRGDMSLVGPRPFPEYHLAAMHKEFRVRRATVPPGLTGLWQITGRGETDVVLQEQLDSFYLDNRSFWFDLSIFLSTFRAVLQGRGAH